MHWVPLTCPVLEGFFHLSKTLTWTSVPVLSLPVAFSLSALPLALSCGWAARSHVWTVMPFKTAVSFCLTSTPSEPRTQSYFLWKPAFARVPRELCKRRERRSLCRWHVPMWACLFHMNLYIYIYAAPPCLHERWLPFFYIQMHKCKQCFTTISAQIVHLEMSGWDFPKDPIPSLTFSPKLAMATCSHFQGLWQVPSSSWKVKFTNGFGGPSSVEVGHRWVGHLKLFNSFLPKSHHLLSPFSASLLPPWTWPLLKTKPQPVS